MACRKCDAVSIRSRLMVSNLATVTSCPSTVVTNGTAGSSICWCRYFVPNFDVAIIFARYHRHPEPCVVRLAHLQFAGPDPSRQPYPVQPGRDPDKLIRALDQDTNGVFRH